MLDEEIIDISALSSFLYLAEIISGRICAYTVDENIQGCRKFSSPCLRHLVERAA
jgi:hypothetical protein